MATKKNGYVIVRTYSAGVHFGRLISRNGREVKLSESRRVHYWTGALSCSELATRGPGQGSKICDPVDIELTEAIEIIQCAPEAAQAIVAYPRWAQK